jgi:exo-beta-1,3-glucanase (GH17 family)
MALRSKPSLRLIVSVLCGILLSIILLLGLRFPRAAAPASLASDYPIKLVPDQMTLTGDYATITNCSHPTVCSWLEGTPTGTIILGVDPTSPYTGTWNGGLATAEISLEDVHSPTLLTLKLSWPDQDGKGLRSSIRDRTAAVTLDGHPLWNKCTTDSDDGGFYYAARHEPILTTIVLTQSVTHTLTISVPGQTAWDLSQIELIAYPYPATIKGIAYSPFRDCQYPGGALQPSVEDVREDLFRLVHTSNAIRTYSATEISSQIPILAKAMGLSVFPGAALDGNEQDEAEVQALCDLACTIDPEGVIVGNEYYLRHRTVTDTQYLIQRIREVKQCIRGCGGNVPVTTAEIDNLMFDWEGLDDFDPEHSSIYRPILDEIDFVMVHTYPFWQDNDYGSTQGKGMPIEGAADFTVRRYKAVQALIERTYPGQNKWVVLGEAGWPTGGSPNGIAVPSLENQRRYLLEFLPLAEEESVEYMYFAAFDELWKIQEPGRVGQHWGYSYSDRAAKHYFYGVLLPSAELLPERLYLPLILRQSGTSTSLVSLSRPLVRPRTTRMASSDLVQVTLGMTFPVFTEWPMGPGHFLPAIWQDDSHHVGLYECDRNDPHSGEMAARASFSPTSSFGSAGIYWLYPEDNWATISESMDLSYTNKVTFWARGKDGGEKIRFLVGGIGTEDDPHPESLRPEESTGFIELEDTWNVYTISLRGKDLTRVIGGFGWAADRCANPDGATFYLDDIVYEYDPNLPEPPAPGPVFPVYTDAAAQDNHYFPTGWMGDMGDIRLDECSPAASHTGDTVIQAEYTAQGTGPYYGCDDRTPCGWSGVYWQHPAHNWGDRPGGYNLTGANALTFWAKGEEGGEWVSFKAGGIGCDLATTPESLCPAQTIDPCPIDLADTWQVYTIRLDSDLDLSNVVGGFLWTASKSDNPGGVSFSMDDIQYLFDVDVPLQPHWIYYGPMLACGYDMGVDTSEGRTDWVRDMDGYMCMDYPSGQDWGAVFITVGPPRGFPRPGKDLSDYQWLSLELRGGSGGEVVSIGLKDNTDRDDGSETKIEVPDLTRKWQTETFELWRFRTADLRRLYVVIEFVFEPGTPPETVCFRRIRYLP